MMEITAPAVEGQEKIITPQALAFLSALEGEFGDRRRALLNDRVKMQESLDAGYKPDFPAETADIRRANWVIRQVPRDLEDRRVEITGPVDRKMIINALNSGACAFMADFEDSNTPTWANLINGQINLRDAVAGTLDYKDPVSGKAYALNDRRAVLMVRPRGLHMEEKHLKRDGRYLSAAFFDFGLYLFHNAKALQAQGTGPYFYLPKLESYHEARLWSEVLVYAENMLGLEQGTIRVTVLIETILAGFQMDEILHALRDHITGLNCGRWDYIFNFIKRFAKHREYTLPDRESVSMTCHFLRSYSLHLIKTCHRRKAHAMGGMAAQIPVKSDEQANRAALEKFTADKEREAGDGHDGTWVAHPALVQRAREIFDKAMPAANQIDKHREDVKVTAADLLRVPEGDVTETGLRRNISVGLLYLHAWLGGNGCVPLNNLMEDAATAEISRMQLWQWRRHRARLKDRRVVDDTLMQSFLDQEARNLVRELGAGKRLQAAIDLFNDLVMSDRPEEFLTTPAYDLIIALERE